MKKLEKFIKKCEEKGITEAERVINTALAEQHRNTRHDVIDEINRFFAFRTDDITQDDIISVAKNIQNLKQRKPE